MKKLFPKIVGGILIGISLAAFAQTSLPRSEWGAPAVTVSHENGKWLITGKKNKVTFNETNFAMTVQNGSAMWTMVSSSTNDMLVKADGKELFIRLADAKHIEIKPYDTGFKTGIKVMLSDWLYKNPSNTLSIDLYLTIALEGRDEELVCDVSAKEWSNAIRQLDWPTALDARDVDYTLLPNGRGNLLPRDWPQAYFPIRNLRNTNDHTVLQSHVIESWSMSWWGFQKGKSAMMVISETPDDAAYQFEHPAGGPTVIGPRWLAQLGKFGYSRSCRFCFFEDGNYVTLAKRYRRYAMETGLFVSLKEKMARTPILADLIGTPQTRVGILRNMSPDSDRYDHNNPSNNYSLTTFDQRAQQLRDLKARGIDRTMVFVSAWPHLGYDRQHPDPLPPPEAAGGWDGMKRFAET